MAPFLLLIKIKEMFLISATKVNSLVLSINANFMSEEEEKEDKFISIAFYFPSPSAKSLEAVSGKSKIFTRRAVSVHAEGRGWSWAVKERSRQVQDLSSPWHRPTLHCILLSTCANIQSIYPNQQQS